MRILRLILIFPAFWACKTLPQVEQRLAGDEEIYGEVLETYDRRPQITDVDPVGMDPQTANRLDREAGISWSDYVRAMVETAAQFWGHIIGLGEGHHAYLMGRDAALLYDVLVYYGRKHFPDELHRIHLINVSQVSVDSEELEGYLGGHGISKDAFSRGRVAHIFDTGWRGVTLGKVKALYPGYEDRFKISFGASQNHGQQNTIPSSRLFFGAVYRDLTTIAPHSYRNRVRQLENIPRFMNRAQGYAQLPGGRLEAAVFAKKIWERQGKLADARQFPTRREYEKNQDWDVLPRSDKNRFIEEYKQYASKRDERAVSVLGNLRRRLDEPELDNLFEKRLFLHWEMSDVIATGDRGAIVSFLKRLLDENSGSFEIEAVVRDAVEKIERHYPDIPEIDRKVDLDLPLAFVRGAGRLGRADAGSSTGAGKDEGSADAVEDSPYTAGFRTLKDAALVIEQQLTREVSTEERSSAVDWLVSEFGASENTDRVVLSVLGDDDPMMRLKAVEYMAGNELSGAGLKVLVAQMRRRGLIMDRSASLVALRALEDASAFDIGELHRYYEGIMSGEDQPRELRERVAEMLAGPLLDGIGELCGRLQIGSAPAR